MHNLFSTIFLFCMVVLLPLNLQAAPDIHKTVLDNGLTVLVTPMPSSDVVSVYAYVKTGAATEGRFMGAGISHFVEHMLFKGTKRRAVGQIAKEVKSLGATINASTDLDYTMYTLDLPKSKLKEGVDIISDMIQNSIFDPVEVEKERKVIHGEMRLYYDRPARRLSVNVFKNVFKKHPYQHSTIGYEALFDGVTRDDLFGYYQRNYIPNNMIIAIAGGLDAQEGLDLVKQHFQNFKQRPYVQRNISPEPPQISERYHEEYYQTPLYSFSLAYQGLPLTDPDVYAMDLLSMILGGGESTRLYQEIYLRKKLVTSISCINYTPVDKGVFEIEGVMTEDNVVQVRAAVLKIIDDVKKRGVTKEELEKVKFKIEADFIYGNQTSSSIAYKSAIDEAMAGDYRFSEHYVELMKRVTVDDIKRVAKRYLNDSMLSITVIKPLAAKKDEIRNPKDQLEIKAQQYVLPNGLTLIIKEDHTAALVSVQAVLNGGLRSENKENNGIASLFSSVWSRSTTHQSESSLVKALERKAVTCASYSGYNALGISMQFLSKDLQYGLDLLSNVIKEPAFEQASIDRQRHNLMVNLDARDDDIRALTFRRVMALLYQQHPNHMDPLGTKETLAKITRKDIVDYYQRFISPSNMVIAVYGDINGEAVKESLDKSLGVLKKKDVSIPKVVEPFPTTPRLENITKDKEQAVVAMAFLAPAFQDKDRYPMEVVNSILGAGLSGRLFVKVRDQLGKAYTVGSSYTPGVDTGNIVLFCLTTNSKVDSVKAIMAQEIADLAANVVEDDELKSVKSYIKGTHQMGLNTIGAQAARAAFNTLYGLGYDHDAHFNDIVDGVTKEDVRAVVKKYLDPQKAVIVTTLGKNGT